MRNNEDDEAQTTMADNFLESMAEKELEFTLHPVASKVIEGLIGHSSPDTFETFTAALLPSLRLLVNASAASFVLESCLKTAALRTLTVKQEKLKEPEDSQPDNKKRKFSKVSSSVDFNLKSDIKPGHKLYCRQLVEKLSRFLLNNMEDYLYENNANHLLRSCLYCLAGILSQKNRFNKVELINIKSQHAVPVPEEWSEILGEFATRLMSWPQFPDLAFDESSSVVLQVLCETLKNVEGQSGTLKKLVKAIMKKSFKDEDDAEESETKETVEFKAFTTQGSTHLLEVMMASCDEKLLNKIYKKYFKDQLIDLSKNGNLNYSVQRLIDSMADKETFEEIFNTLTPEFTNLCQIGYTGVVLAVCKACERLGVKQGQFIQSLLKSLECAAEKTGKCILPIITLTPLPIVEERNIKKITLHGSLILQHIFQFNKPIKIIQSLLDMKPQDIADIFCDDKGSRIADAYLESKFIGEKSREKLIKQLEGMYMTMAVSKSGSHVLEKFYKLSSDSQKEAIVIELAERLNQLNGCVSGRILNYKFSVETYSRNPNQWKSFLARNSATKSR